MKKFKHRHHYSKSGYDPYNAQNANAQAALKEKFENLESLQKKAIKIEKTPDGKIRYYKKETPSATPGPTRGAAYVTEYNPSTGRLRGFMECYDHNGKVNRIHNKKINGEKINAPHNPSTAQDFKIFLELQKKPK